MIELLKRKYNIKNLYNEGEKLLVYLNKKGDALFGAWDFYGCSEKKWDFKKEEFEFSYSRNKLGRVRNQLLKNDNLMNDADLADLFQEVGWEMRDRGCKTVTFILDE